MYTLDIKFLNDRKGEKPSKDSTVKKVLHKINHFKYKNFSEGVTGCFASKPLKKTVLNLANSLFKKHANGELSKQDFNKLVSETVTAIIKEDSFTSPEYGSASREQIRDQKQQLINITLRQGLQELFDNVAKTSKDDDLEKFIINLKNWSRQSGQSTTTVRMKQLPVSYLPPPETQEILGNLKLQVSNYNTPNLPIGQVSENSTHPLIVQLSQLKQDTLTNDSYRTIEIKSQDDLQMFNQILANRNHYGRMLDHELRVDFSHYEGGDVSQDKNFTQADFSGLKLKFFIDSTLDGSFEGTFRNVLSEGTRRFANDVAFKLSQGESITTKNIQPQSWSVVVVETDPSKMSIDRIEREVDNASAGLAKLSLLGLVNSKKNQTAQFIEDNRQSIHEAIWGNSHFEIPGILIDQYLTKQVQDLRGASSPQVLNINDERIIPFLKNIKQMEVNLKTVLQEMNPQIDVTYKPLTQTESFSESIQGFKSSVNSLSDLNTRVNLLAAVYQQEEQQNLVNSISDKITNTSEAKRFIDEYIEQRFQANVDKSDRVTSEIAFETFIRKSSVVYGLSGEDLKALTLKCEEYFRAKSTIDLIQPEENKIFRFTTQSNSEVFGELSKDPMTQLNNFALKNAERQKTLAKQEGTLEECEIRLEQEATLLKKLFDIQARPLAAVLSDLFLSNSTEKASDILNSACNLVLEKNTQFSTQYPNIRAEENPLEILQNNLFEYRRNFQEISETKGEDFAVIYLNTAANFQALSTFSQREIDHMFNDPMHAEKDFKALMIELNTEAMNQTLPLNLTTPQKALLDNVLNLYIFSDDGVNQSNYTAATDTFMNIVKTYSYPNVSESLQSLLLPAVQDFLTPKNVVIEQVLTQSFKDPSFNNYSQEQKSLYIDLQKQSQELSNSDFSNYIITNLFEKYFENVEKRPSNEGFNQFVSRSIAVVNSIDSSLEQTLVFNREPDLAKISTNKSFQAVSEVLKNPKTLIASILPPLDKTFIHDLPGYNQITDQVKGAFLDTLLGNSSFEMVSDTLVKLLQGSIPSKETVLTVPVNEDFNPDLYNMVFSNNGREAQVLAIPPRVGNDELLAKILEQCEIHLTEFGKKANLSKDTLRQVFSNSHLGNLFETFVGTDENAKQELRKKIISSELERNSLDSGLISPRSHEILNERAIEKQYLLATLEPSENSTKILADINKLYEFITDMNSKDSPYQRFNGLVLDNFSVDFNTKFYASLNKPMAPAAMKQSLFHEINSEPNNWSEAAKLGINSDKYKEFRIDILLMQRKGSSEEEIKEFVKLNLASVFDTLPENNAESLKAIGQVVGNVDSKLTSDMKAHSLSSLNLESSIKAALDTPANKIKNQMQAALENVLTPSNKANIKLPETIKNTNAPAIQFYLDTQKLITEMRLANPASAGTAKDISNAIFGKLATYINEAAKEAKLEGFNLLALRDTEKEFVAKLLNNLGVSNKALDHYFTTHQAQVFEASVQSVFQPSSAVSVLDSVNKVASISAPTPAGSASGAVTSQLTWNKHSVQALIDDAVIDLLTAPEENALRTKSFGTDVAAAAEQLKIPVKTDILQAYIEVSRELINSKRANPHDRTAVVQDIISENGIFTQNIKNEKPGILEKPEAKALFYGQYQAFKNIAEQLKGLLEANENLEFLNQTFRPVQGQMETALELISYDLLFKKSSETEGFINQYLLADQSINSSSNGINQDILGNQLSIGKRENINSLALISLILKGDRPAVAQELKEYLEAKNAILTETVDGGRIPYVDTDSTHAKLQAGSALGAELMNGNLAEATLTKAALKESIQSIIDSVKTANLKDPSIELIAGNYPSEALTEILTKSIFGESQNLDATIYKLYKESQYNPEFLKQTETILVGLNEIAKAGADFKLCPDLQTKCAELNSSWEAASAVNPKASQRLRLDFAITEEVKLNNDDLNLVNAYVSLRKGFSTTTGGTDAEKTSRDSQNLRLIEEFKKIHNEQKPQAEYNAQNPAYVTALATLNDKYSSIVEAHGTPVNAGFVKNITDFAKESDDLLVPVSTLAQDELIKIFKSAEIGKPQSATDEEIAKKADAYLKTYNHMQALSRQNPVFFENYIDNTVDKALEQSPQQADGILRTFANIIQTLDKIFGGLLVNSPKANFTPLLGTYDEIRQEQGQKLYSLNE